MKVNAALNLGTINNAQVLITSTHITTNMTGNALFSAADIVAQVTATVTSTTNLRNAINAPTSDTKTDTINASRDTLDRNLTILAGKVEGVANSPTLVDDQRVGVIHSAGMEVRGHNQPKKRVFAVNQGDTSGSVHITAEGGANAHEWQYTSDTVNFTGRISAATTTKATTDINGLTIATKYAFFHKPILAGTTTDWEGPLFLTVL
jgi:hypothetical protein